MSSTVKAEKSQKILDTLRRNVASLKQLLDGVEDKETIQILMRSMILFSCSGIDAVVKQLIIDNLEFVIERDTGAQEQLRNYAKKKLQNGQKTDYDLLAELLTAINSRKVLIDMLKKDLSFDSLQSSEQLYRVASYFNIKTDKLANKEEMEMLKCVFSVRNKIVHQMDVNFDSPDMSFFQHNIDEVTKYYNVIERTAQKYIDEVNDILKKKITKEYEPIFSVEGEKLTFRTDYL